jgi:hypothetical protein
MDASSDDAIGSTLAALGSALDGLLLSSRAAAGGGGPPPSPAALSAALSGAPPAESASLLEVALRAHALRHLSSRPRPPLHPFLSNVLDLCVACAAASPRLLEPAAVFAVLEDAFEACSVGDAESVWRLVEARRDALFPLVQGAAQQRARLALLRVCSGLLRRLSRSADTVMCGKILLFLAFTLPLSERSGVNVTGSFNTENAARFEGEAEDGEGVLGAAQAWRAPGGAAPAGGAPRAPAAAAAAAASAAAQKAAAAAPPLPAPPEREEPFSLGGRFHVPAVAESVGGAWAAAEAGGAAASPAFYRTFWRLQRFLYNPALATSSAEVWALAAGGLRAVLRAFEREDEDSGVAAAKRRAGGGGGGVEDGEAEGAARRAALASAAAGRQAPGAAAAAARAPPILIPSLSAVTVSKFDFAARAGGGGGGPAVGAGAGGEGAAAAGDALFGGKYLTAPALLALELSDPALRRHILLQALIFLQHVSQPPRRGGGGGGSGAELPRPLAAALARDCAALRELCLILLRRSPPDGPHFAAVVAALLVHEAHLIAWKQGGAQPFERPLPPPPAAAAEGEEGAAAAAAAAAPAAKRPRGGGGGGGGGPTGAPAKRPYSWASEGLEQSPMAVSADPARGVKPTLAAYIVPLRLALDPTMGIEAEDNPARKPLYVWRGLRLLAEEKLEAFFKVAAGGKTFEDAVVGAFGLRIPKKEEEEAAAAEAAPAAAAAAVAAGEGAGGEGAAAAAAGGDAPPPPPPPPSDKAAAESAAAEEAAPAPSEGGDGGGGGE